jgi:hypothetical protein
MLKTLEKNWFIIKEHKNNHISYHKSIYFSMEDELGNTTPDIWFSFLGQSLLFLFERSVLIYSNNNRKPWLSSNRIPKRIQPAHGLLSYLFAVILNTNTKLTRDVFGNAIFKEVSEETSIKWSLFGNTECTSYQFTIECVHYAVKFFYFRKRETVLKMKFQKINVLYSFFFLFRFVLCSPE